MENIINTIIEMRTMIEIEHKHNGTFDCETMESVKNVLKKNLRLLLKFKYEND